MTNYITIMMIYLENESKWPGRICFHLVNPSIQCILQKNESFVIQAVRNIERWVEQQLIWALECILYRYTVHVKDIILLLNIILLCNTGAPRAQRWGEGGGLERREQTHSFNFLHPRHLSLFEISTPGYLENIMCLVVGIVCCFSCVTLFD